MLSVIVGSKNPVKLGAARHVFSRAFSPMEISVSGLEVSMPCEIGNMPVGDDATRLGAIHRAQSVLGQADFGVGMEGGVVFEGEGSFLVNWCAVMDDTGELSVTSSSRLPLPRFLTQAIRDGEELGPFLEAWTGRKDIRTGTGAVGFLTKGVLERQMFFEPCLACALAPFLHRELYRHG